MAAGISKGRHVSQLITAWNMLEMQRKVVVVLAILATSIAFISIVRMASSPSMSLLYSGLDSSTSNEIITSLEQKAITFEVKGDAIYVGSAARDRARLSLASEGLPSNGPAGYELLDTLSGFGTTAQMFDAAYLRAKEGELARTILASAQIKMARVHIANPGPQPFRRDVLPTASVTVTGKQGPVGTAQAEAIRYLVAAAVSGLSPDQVTVIDSAYGIVLQPGDTNVVTGNTGELDARANELRGNIERLLSARVGQGNVMVEVMVEARTQSETITQRVLDPEGSVPISSDSETQTDTTSGGSSGAVTVASNLPDTADGAGSGGTSSSLSKSRERVNYDISETVTERFAPAGEISRLSVAVLINEQISQGPNGTVYTPRTSDEIAAFMALVQSAIGFNEARGDIVTIESMEFPQAGVLGTTATAGLLSNFVFDLPMLVQMTILSFVALGLGMFVIKPILVNPTPQIPRLPNGLIPTQSTTNEPQNLLEVGTTNSLSNVLEPAKDPIDILKETIALRSEESGHLLRSWIENESSNEKEAV